MSSSLKYKGTIYSSNSLFNNPEDGEMDKKKQTEADSGKKKSYFAHYQSLMVRYPIPMNALQSSIISGLAVIISQIITHGLVTDRVEIRTMMFINIIYHTPILYVFYTWLNALHLNMVWTLIIDQLLFSPLFTCGVVALRMFLRGGEIGAIPRTVMEVVPHAMKSSWSFWIPMRFLILTYVPVPFQLLSGSCAALIWHIIFSMILNAKK